MKQVLKKQEVGFTQIKNEILANKKLSWKAKGLFSYLYSKPNNWNFSAERIAQESPEGNHVVRTGLKELEKYGYLKRKKMQDGRVKYYIRYNPDVENQHHTQEVVDADTSSQTTKNPMWENRNVGKSPP